MYKKKHSQFHDSTAPGLVGDYNKIKRGIAIIIYFPDERIKILKVKKDKL
jgi:hypothetical protein